MPLKPNAHVIDADIRNRIFDLLGIKNIKEFSKVNDCQWGIVLEDQTGTSRYARINVIVARPNEAMTAQEMMDSEHNKYLVQKKKNEDAAIARAKKAEEDKARRAKKAAEKAAKEKE